MEGLAPPLDLLLRVRRVIERGSPLKWGIQNYIECDPSDFSICVAQWYLLCQQEQSTQSLLARIPSPHRRHLLEVLERGLRREPILPVLAALETEIIEACEDEIQKKLTHLPYQLLIPLLLFQFPAFMILLLGPFLLKLVESLK